MPTRTASLDAKGKPAGTLELRPRCSASRSACPLLHQAVERELADRRAGTHDTKGRSEVSGGGKKPWKQKGTGRARQGSIRATQWKGGGKPFGPTPRSYDKAMPRQMRREALRAAVAAKIAARRARGRREPRRLDGKTKTLVTGLGRARGSRTRPTLVVRARRWTSGLLRAARNVPWLTVETPGARVGLPAAARASASCSSARPWWRSRRRSRHESRSARQILIRPLMTEKSMRQKEEQNTVAFQVGPTPTRSRSARRSRRVFNVKVTAVRTASFEGKLKRMGRFQGRRAGLEEGDRDAGRRPQDRALRGGLSAMAIRTVKPTSPGPALPHVRHLRRDHQDRAREGAARCPSGGRTAATAYGRITVRHRGGGDKRMLRAGRLPARQVRDSRRGSPRSSTIRTARRGSRCSTIATARSATSSRPTASRSATP